MWHFTLGYNIACILFQALQTKYSVHLVQANGFQGSSPMESFCQKRNRTSVICILLGNNPILFPSQIHTTEIHVIIKQDIVCISNTGTEKNMRQKVSSVERHILKQKHLKMFMLKHLWLQDSGRAGKHSSEEYL